jgi:glycosyltransferase involved in cell wall biosynthesis
MKADEIRLSLIVPAHNEERLIDGTLAAAREALAVNGLSEASEIIVSDDASTDRTAEIARRAGAMVVFSGKRNIGGARNDGAAVARGRFLLFVDADTWINPKALQETLESLDEGAVGGGATLRWDVPVSRTGGMILDFWNRLSRLVRAPAGGYFFARRDAFEKAGGFDESFLVTEEIWLGFKLRRLGRMVIVRTPVTTSARKLKSHSPWELIRILMFISLHPWHAARRRKGLELWYSRRD